MWEKGAPASSGAKIEVWQTLIPRRSCSAQSCGWPCIATGRKVSPSKRCSPPRVAPQRVRASSNIASKTGCSSPGEELMTCNTSVVAVCCSSDSRSSLNSRVFSITMTAWSAKVRTSSICRSVNGATRPRASKMTPMGSASRIRGTPSRVRCVAAATLRA
jgi:hypothetical protein